MSNATERWRKQWKSKPKRNSARSVSSMDDWIDRMNAQRFSRDRYICTHIHAKTVSSATTQAKSQMSYKRSICKCLWMLCFFADERFFSLHGWTPFSCACIFTVVCRSLFFAFILVCLHSVDWKKKITFETTEHTVRTKTYMVSVCCGGDRFRDALTVSTRVCRVESTLSWTL